MAVVGFPLDSRVTGFDENGLPTYTNKYHSTDYRKMLAALVSNGVISDGGSELKVVPVNQNAMSNQTVAVKINDGTAVLDGAFVTVESETLNISAPTNIDPHNIGLRYDYVIIRVETLDNGDNDEEASVELVKGLTINDNSTPNDPVVTGRYLVLAKILSKTVKNSDGTYTYSHQIQDTRSSSLCGFAAPFANVDLSAVNEAIAEMEHQTQVAVQVSQNALDGTTAGNLTQEIDALKTRIGNLEKKLTLNNVPMIEFVKEPNSCSIQFRESRDPSVFRSFVFYKDAPKIGVFYKNADGTSGFDWVKQF